MSRTISYLLFALLAIGVCTQYVPDMTVPSCDTHMNHFLGWLTNGNDTSSIPLLTPLNGTNFSICNEKWSVMGTCCNQTLMNAFYNTSMIAGKTSWNLFIASLAKITSSLTKMQTMVNTNRTDTKMKLNASITMNSSIFSGLTDEQATVLAEEANNFTTDLATFKIDGPKCFNATAQAKGKIFCIGCSANPADGTTFGTDASVTISLNSCNSVTASCFSTWMFMFKVQGMMEMIGTLNRQRSLATLGLAADGTNATTGVAPPSSSNSSMNPPPPPSMPTTPLGRSVMMNDTLVAFQNCNGTVAGSCTQAMMTTICTAFFNFMAPEKQAGGLDDPSTVTSSANSSRRLLASSFDGGMTPTASGVDLTASMTIPTTSATIDAYTSSSTTTKSSSKAIVSIISMIAFLFALLN